MDEVENEPEFSAHAREVLERIYVEAKGPLKLGDPLLTLPAKSVLRATDGKFKGLVFIDLRTIIDLIKSGLPTADPEAPRDMTHPDYRCPGCNRPIEPIAAIRTYHAGCDPQGRVGMLEKALIGLVLACDADDVYEEDASDRPAMKAARAVLAYRPAQMKERG